MIIFIVPMETHTQSARPTTIIMRSFVRSRVGHQDLPLETVTEATEPDVLADVTRHDDALSMTNLQGDGEGGPRRCDRQRQSWSVNIKDWAQTTFHDLDGREQNNLVKDSASYALSLPHPTHPPNTHAHARTKRRTHAHRHMRTRTVASRDRDDE